MSLSVQRDGGSSLSSPENLRRVARRIVESRRDGQARKVRQLEQSQEVAS